MTIGVVTKINKKAITVRATCQTACEKCERHEACLIKNTFREFNISVPDIKSYHIGEEVDLSVSNKNIWISVFWAYMLPLIVILVSLTGFSLLKYTELWCALATLSVLAMYYVVLFFLNEKLKKRLIIEVKKNPVD